MQSLIKKIESLKKQPISNIISRRIKEFENNRKSNHKIFSELCFCILTANFQAEKSIKIQKKLEKDFFLSSKKVLANKLKKEGHRFWSQRAEFICYARKQKKEIFDILKNKKEVREELFKKIKGFGMKEASHFLRNIGYKNVAIVDFHIVDLLVKKGLIKRPKTITKKVYLQIEEVLFSLAKKTNLSLAELDLYLWFIETGKVLK